MGLNILTCDMIRMFTVPTPPPRSFDLPLSLGNFIGLPAGRPLKRIREKREV